VYISVDRTKHLRAEWS